VDCPQPLFFALLSTMLFWNPSPLGDFLIKRSIRHILINRRGNNCLFFFVFVPCPRYNPMYRGFRHPPYSQIPLFGPFFSLFILFNRSGVNGMGFFFYVFGVPSCVGGLCFFFPPLLFLVENNFSTQVFSASCRENLLFFPPSVSEYGFVL